MPRKKSDQKQPVPSDPPPLDNGPTARDGLVFLDTQYAKIEAMMYVLVKNTGVIDDKGFNAEAMDRFIESRATTYEEHSERDLKSNGKAWTCTCEVCGVFRIAKIREVFGYMREVQKWFADQWDDLLRMAREWDAERKSWGALARFAPENHKLAGDQLEKFAHELVASRERQIGPLGNELRLLLAPILAARRTK